MLLALVLFLTIDAVDVAWAGTVKHSLLCKKSWLLGAALLEAMMQDPPEPGLVVVRVNIPGCYPSCNAALCMKLKL